MKVTLTDSGLSSTSSGSAKSVTIVNNVDRSNGQLFLRHAIWTSAVKKLSGMWSPDSHITRGSPADAQYLYWMARRFKCSIQLERDLHVSGANFLQSSGICPLKSELATLSSTTSIPISPANAFLSKLSVTNMRSTRRLNLSSSCRSTINVGVMFIAKDFFILQTSNEGGSFLRMSSATLSMNWSRLMPPDAGPEGWRKKEIILCASEHKKAPLKIN